jgi:hypothetical protein
MIFGDQIQQVFKDAVRLVAEHPGVVGGIAAAIGAVVTYAVRDHNTPMASVERTLKKAQARARKQAKAQTEPYTSKPYQPDLPLPDAADRAHAAQFPDSRFSAWDMGELYRKGRDEGDLAMAMAGLRLYTQFVIDGGDKTVSSPWPEYQTLSGAYLRLARQHNSRECLQFAYTALQACYHNIYSEPATVRLERDISEELHALKKELEGDSILTPSG